MPPPSALAIKSSAVIRLIKEESMYHRELVVEQNRLSKMKESNEADEYTIKQQVSSTLPAFDEADMTNRAKSSKRLSLLSPLFGEKLQAALEVLENQLVSFAISLPLLMVLIHIQQAGAPKTEPAENKEKAEKAIADAKAVLAE
jgi:tubulin-specific chaperone A